MRRAGRILAFALTAFGALSPAPLLAQQSPAGTAVAGAQAGSVATAGQSATLLPDGRVLILGSGSSASREARVLDPRTGEVRVLAAGMVRARAHHSATLIPDGRVLILGGIGADGTVVREAEVFDPVAERFESLGDPGVIFRARHTVSLLTCGRLLILGGVDERGASVDMAEMFNPRTGEVHWIERGPGLERNDAQARLLPSGGVLVSGGTGREGQPVTSALLFQMNEMAFQALSAAEAEALLQAADRSETFALAGSLPLAEADEFPPDGLIGLRFSRPAVVTSVSARTITLLGPEGPVAAKVIPSQDGMHAFVTPKVPLFPSARYTIFINGVADAAGRPLEFEALGFNVATLPAPAPTATPLPSEPQGTSPTAALPPDTSSAPSTATAVAAGTLPPALTVAELDADDEVFRPDERHRGGRWRTGRAFPEELQKRLHDRLWKKGPVAYEHVYRAAQATRAAARPAPVGAPSVAGQVLRLNDQPLAGIPVSIGTISTRSDAQGHFALYGLPPGHHEMLVDGLAGGASGAQYGQFVIGVDVVAGTTTEVPPIFLPRIRSTDWIPIASPAPADLVITHPNVPGMEIHVPKGTILRNRDGSLVTRVALVPIPLDRSPFAFPENTPIYVSVQPGGMVVQGLSPATSRGVRVVYPNLSDEQPGAVADFWHYDPAGKGWYVYGRGSASADGRYIMPDPGLGLYDTVGFSYTPDSGAPPPEKRPPPCPPPSPNRPCCDKRGDPVSCASGLFVHERTDLALRDVLPLDLTRTHRPGDTTIRPFGYGASHPYAMYLYFPDRVTFSSAQLVLSDGGTIDFVRVSPGTGYGNAEFEHTASSSAYHGARIKYGVTAARWDMTLKDGSVYEFSGYSGAALQALRDRYGNALEITRFGGRPVRVTTPGGRYLDFTYDTANRITRIQDFTGRAITYSYSAAGYLTRATYPDGSYEEYTYDASNRMTTVRDPRGNIMVTNEYDANGRVTRQTLAEGGVFQYAYTTDANGKVTRSDVTDPRGQVERLDFNALGAIVTRTLALGTPLEQTTSHEYQAGTSIPLATVDALGRRAEYGYDARGNLAALTRLAGTAEAVTQTTTYMTDFNQPATVTDPLGHVSSSTYDSLGRLTEARDPLGNLTRFEYNPSGQVTRVIDPRGQATDFTYDLFDLRSVTDPLGRVSTFSTDLLGRLATVADPLGNLTRYEYDVNDRRIRATDALGQATALAWDANGNLLSVTDAKGGVSQFAYDAKNRTTTRTDALLAAESYGYDAANNLTTHTDRKGQATTYAYDALNRRTSATYADGSRTDYTYDAAGRLTKAEEFASGAGTPWHTLTRSYDGLDRLTQEQSPEGTVNYGYDAAGRRTAMTVAGQGAVSYAWDDANRLTQIAQGAATVGLAYDAAGRRTTLTLPNGIAVEYGYDNANQLVSLTYKQGTTVLGDLGYTYDAAGRRTAKGGSLADTGLPAELTAASFDAGNRLTAWGSQTLTYDANGGLLSDGARSLAWDARNRLASLSGTTSASFQYDAFGRRIAKTVNGVTTRFLHDGLNPVQELDGTNTPTANLLTGLGLDEFYTRSDAQGARHILPDALGSAIALTDPTGALVKRYTYEPYGETGTTGEASANPFQYTGRENDGTGLYYYRARYYDPRLKQWISEDPIGFAGGINTYLYVGGNPVNRVDPKGLQGQDIFGQSPKPQGQGPTLPPQPEARVTYDVCVFTAACVGAAAGGVLSRSFVGAGVGFVGGAVVGATFCPGEPPNKKAEQ